MKRIILLMLLAFAIIGCQQSSVNETVEDQIFQMKTFGAFTMPSMAVTLVTVTPDEVNYLTMSYDGIVSKNLTKQISTEQYQSLVYAFETANFKTMDESIKLDVQVADVGMVNLTLIEGDYSKTVHIDPYYTPDLPSSIRNILRQFQGLSIYAQELSGEGVKKMAEEFILNSPTYQYDGSGIKLKDYFVMESFPAQHQLTYTFTSSHGGYGDRSDVMAMHVITEHEVSIRIVQGRVVSAVMDDQWDMLEQEIIGRETTEMMFEPMACVTTPWNEWYASGAIQFIRAPTEPELIHAYYSSKNIEIENVVQIEREGGVCKACKVCPEMTYFTAETTDVDALQSDGWTIV